MRSAVSSEWLRRRWSTWLPSFGSLWQGIALEQSWLDQALAALKDADVVLHLGLGDQLQSATLEALLPHVPLLSAWASRYTKACVELGAAMRDSILQKAAGLARLEGAGLVLQVVSARLQHQGCTSSAHVVGAWQACLLAICGRSDMPGMWHLLVDDVAPPGARLEVARLC